MRAWVATVLLPKETLHSTTRCLPSIIPPKTDKLDKQKTRVDNDFFLIRPTTVPSCSCWSRHFPTGLGPRFHHHPYFLPHHNHQKGLGSQMCSNSGSQACSDSGSQMCSDLQACPGSTPPERKRHRRGSWFCWGNGEPCVPPHHSRGNDLP